MNRVEYTPMKEGTPLSFDSALKQLIHYSKEKDELKIKECYDRLWSLYNKMAKERNNLKIKTNEYIR